MPWDCTCVQVEAIAADAKADLDVAMPALDQAMTEVDKLDKNSISEVMARSPPPPSSSLAQIQASFSILTGRLKFDVRCGGVVCLSLLANLSWQLACV